MVVFDVIHNTYIVHKSEVLVLYVYNVNVVELEGGVLTTYNAHIHKLTGMGDRHVM